MSHLQELLPDYMVPSRIVFLEQFPLTPNGKINRTALSQIKSARPELDTLYVTPRKPAEVKIAKIFQSLLNIEQVGLDDDFFLLGGDSLQLMRLRSEIPKRLDVELSINNLFEWRTVRTIAEQVLNNEVGDDEEPSETSQPIRKISSSTNQDIAIIGMAGRFPGADNIDEFWEMLINGKEGVRQLTEEELREGELDFDSKKDDPDYVPVAGLINDVEMFDADFFNIHPVEARSLDPQQRVWFETAWHALENAGYSPDKENRPIGVFAGSYMNGYLLHNLLPNREEMEQFVRVQDPQSFMHMINNEKDYMPTKTSHLFNLKGPSINVQTACSTSLVAISLACQSIQNGDCDMALAGGVSVFIPQKQGYFFQEGGIRAKDGHCKPFDADASGTIFSSGLGCVVLKRLDMALEDRDHILAVVKGAAMNNDGSNKASYTAPSIAGQVDVIQKAQERAGVDVETIEYIEAHGTATPLGDPIEVSALSKAFRKKTKKDQFAAIGSVKSNIGHLDAAAGVAGVIKTVMALDKQLIPPTLHFDKPNPEIDFASSPFFVNKKVMPWPKKNTPRRAGVSSFGIGGTNAHIILEEAPSLRPSSDSRPRQLLLLSAKTKNALVQKRVELADYLENQRPNLADVAFTLVMGRSDFAHRQVIVANGLKDAIEKLRSKPAGNSAHLKAAQPELVMMFPGQGSQFVGMGRELFEIEPLYRQTILHCAEFLEPLLGENILDVLYPHDPESTKAAERLTQTGLAQPAIFMVSYALMRLWQSWGIEPDVLVGHSVGEYVAACLAGVFSVEDALTIIANRARLMQSLPSGSMQAIRLPAHKLEPMLGQGVELAAANTPNLSVVSGPTPAVESFVQQLKSHEIEAIPLHTSHAFHSHMMEPILDEFEGIVRDVSRHEPQTPIISTRTGAPLTASEATNPEYWANQLRDAVLFSEAANHLLNVPGRVYLEVGPGNTLSNAMLQHREASEANSRPNVINSLGHPKLAQPALEPMLTGLGQLWLSGVEIDWASFYQSETRYRIPLPTYPFERVRYWVDPPAQRVLQAPKFVDKQEISLTGSVAKETVPAILDVGTAGSETDNLILELASLIGAISGLEITPDDYGSSFIQLGFDSLLLTQVSSAIKKAYQVNVPFRALLGDVSTLENLAEFCLESPSFKPNNQSSPVSTSAQTLIIPSGPNNQAIDVNAGLVEQLLQNQLDMQKMIGQQQQMINQLLKQQAELKTKLELEAAPSTDTTIKIPTITGANSFPLTLDQSGIWLNSQLSPEANSAYNVAQLIHLDGEMDRELLLEVANQTFLAHDSYHIRFDPTGSMQ
ncbi:MAG: beta-ketoacyl synthase N-terminal-like domain-containing protein, partial [Chloroflexota bacterium]